MIALGCRSDEPCRARRESNIDRRSGLTSSQEGEERRQGDGGGPAEGGGSERRGRGSRSRVPREARGSEGEGEREEQREERRGLDGGGGRWRVVGPTRTTMAKGWPLSFCLFFLPPLLDGCRLFLSAGPFSPFSPHFPFLSDSLRCAFRFHTPAAAAAAHSTAPSVLLSVTWFVLHATFRGTPKFFVVPSQNSLFKAAVFFVRRRATDLIPFFLLFVFSRSLAPSCLLLPFSRLTRSSRLALSCYASSAAVRFSRVTVSTVLLRPRDFRRRSSLHEI